MIYLQFNDGKFLRIIQDGYIIFYSYQVSQDYATKFKTEAEVRQTVDEMNEHLTAEPKEILNYYSKTKIVWKTS